MRRPTILVIGTCDTKGAEITYLVEALGHLGADAHVMDVGVLGDATVPVDTSAAEVAAAGGSALADLRAGGGRATALDVMSEGAARLARGLVATGRIDGVLAAGGGGNTTVATAAMRALPLGLPKVMLSTVASGDTSGFVGGSDIAMLHAVVDVASLNPVLRHVLWNAAAAAAGMARAPYAPPVDAHPEVLASMFGITTACVNAASETLVRSGYDVVVFHATGTGGRSMERAIEERRPAAVLDVTTTEWADEIVGGILGAGPERLTAAGRLGIPQVVAPGALDACNFGAPSTIPSRFAGRVLHQHNPTVTLMRTTPDECRAIARAIVERLNRAEGAVTVCLPLGGISDLDRPGMPFYDAEADAVLFEELTAGLDTRIRVVESAAHINDPAFADCLTTELLALA